MLGRITSVLANEHGVNYRELLQRERQATARLVDAYQAALEAWEKVHSAKVKSAERKMLLRRAQHLTARARA